MKLLKTAHAVSLAIWAGLNMVIGAIFISIRGLLFLIFCHEYQLECFNTGIAVNVVFDRPISIFQ